MTGRHWLLFAAMCCIWGVPYLLIRIAVHDMSAPDLVFARTGIAALMFFALLAGIGPARAVVITYVNPAVAVLLGVLTLGEKLTIGMAVGFPLIMAGSILAARRGREVHRSPARYRPPAPSP
jgi:drug/metabolite transporter (DMT)-like permease